MKVKPDEKERDKKCHSIERSNNNLRAIVSIVKRTKNKTQTSHLTKVRKRERHIFVQF